jgi:hypothetical protein
VDRRQYRRQLVEARRLGTERWQQRYAELSAEFGLTFARLERDGAKNLAKLRRDYRALPGRIPCRAHLVDGAVVDPALLVAPGSTYHERYGYYESQWWLDTNATIVVAGQVRGLEPSTFALPPKVALAAAKRPEIRMSTYIPLLVRVGGEARFLVPEFAVVVECGLVRGADVDPQFFAEPSESKHRTGQYRWFDPMNERTVRIYAQL